MCSWWKMMVWLILIWTLNHSVTAQPQRDTATQRTQSVTAHTFRINAFSWCWGFICAFQSLKLRHILRPLHPEAPLWDSNRKITCYLFYSTLSDARIITFKEKRTGLFISAPCSSCRDSSAPHVFQMILVLMTHLSHSLLLRWGFTSSYCVGSNN